MPDEMSEPLLSRTTDPQLLHYKAEWKECDGGNSATEVDVMTSSVLLSPAHPGKRTERFEEVRQNYDDEEPCAYELQKGK